MKSYGSVAPARALRRAPSAIDVYADDDAAPRASSPTAAGDEDTPLLGSPSSPLSSRQAIRSSWWSVVFFSWCEYLTTVCAERPLRVEDTWALDISSMSLVCAQYFKLKVENLQCVVRAFHVTQAGILFVSGLLTLASVVCELITPVAVYRVVDTAGNGGFEELWSRGTLWTGILLFARFMRSFLLGWADFLLNYALVRTTGPLNILLLESVLKGNGHRLGRQNAEDATNLFATDIETVSRIIKVFHRVWSLPLVLTGLCYIFNLIIGQAFTGIFVVCPAIYLVIQLLNIKETWLLREWIRTSDTRFAELYSMFDQILGVKLNAWQSRVLASVEAIRREEKQILRRYTIIRTVRMSLTWTAPSFNLVATGVIIAYSSTRMLTTPAQTFAAVAIFHAINDAFVELVTVFRACLEFRMSLGRIQAAVPVACHVPSSLPFDFLTRDSRPCLFPDVCREDKAAVVLEEPIISDHEAIALVNASFSVPGQSEAEPLLDYISLRVRRGEFIVVHGKVGSGKSVLLKTITGLMHKTRGKAEIVGSIAYCSQSPWIQSTTVRDNVLFGRAFDPERYWNVLSACELLQDIQALPLGDQTTVGSRSYVSLSSGQQSRIALARACYADADIYVLDSPLDCVDSIVQCEILLKCMGRLLQNKTIILASHNPEVIMSEYVDRTVRMEGMEIVRPQEEQMPNRRSSTSGKVGNSIPPTQRSLKTQDFVSRRCRLLAASDRLGRQRRPSSVAKDGSRLTELLLDPSVCFHPRVMEIQALSKLTTATFPSPTSTASGDLNQSSRLVDHRDIGDRRRWRKAVIQEYLSHSRSPWRLFVVIFLHFFTQVLSTASIYSFSRWMSQYSILRNSKNYSREEAFDASMNAFHQYVALVVASAVAFLVTAHATFTFSRGVSDRLFRAMTTSLLQTRLSFFAETTVGKLLNRYCRDLQAVDSTLQDCVFALLKTFFGCYCALFASFGWMTGHMVKSSMANQKKVTEMKALGLEPLTSFNVWLAITFGNLLLTSCVISLVWLVGVRSNRPSSELFLMHREAMSPIFTFASESIVGKSTIRAFGADQRERITERFAELLDRLTRISWTIWCFESWLTMRSLLLENLITGTLLVGLICFGHDADASRPATIGLLLLLLLNLREDLKNVFEHWNALEKNLVCLQRVFEYIHLEPEVTANPELPLALVDPVLWPRNGALSFSHVDFQYGHYIIPGHHNQQTMHLHLTLRDVSFQVQRGERVGIIGRSGAGKSSLAMALLRVNNPTRGVITLDGVDITRVELSVLRSKVSYLPPNPVFYSGSLREYLDPFASSENEGAASLDDFELWTVLEKTGLKPAIRRVPRQLDAVLEEIVNAWSNGERQLLCLARALILRAKVVFLDEATTATDQETDFSVQRVVCQSLEPDMTLLCISHRIDAVLKFDKLLVVSEGQVQGFGTLDELVASGDGEFFDLIENAQLVY